MPTQERQLEEHFIEKLRGLKYEWVRILSVDSKHE